MARKTIWAFDEHPSSSEMPSRKFGHFVHGPEHADVSVIAVTYNNESDIETMLRSLRLAANELSLRLIVVDNDSSDGTVAFLASQRDVTVIRSGCNRGYAGGINIGLRLIGDCDHVLILNPDLIVERTAINRMLTAAQGGGVGAVVPLMIDGKNSIVPSLHREPSVVRSFFDAIFGARRHPWRLLPSETDFHRDSYDVPHDVDWASGAALLVPTQVLQDVGRWNEDFFLYSEEVEYFRRIRQKGLRIRFEPGAVVRHPGRGSGSSEKLDALKAVNRVRYIEMHHGNAYSNLFRAVLLLERALRSHRRADRYTMKVLIRRTRWQQLNDELAAKVRVDTSAIAQLPRRVNPEQ